MVNNYIYAMLEKGSIHCQKVQHYDYWEPFPPTREVNLDAVGQLSDQAAFSLHAACIQYGFSVSRLVYFY